MCIWRRKSARIRKEGVDCFGVLSETSYDPRLERADGRIPCRLSVEWTHPTTHEKLEFKSPWFWTNPRSGGDRLEFDKIPVRVVLSDPARLHQVDLSGFNLELL